MVDNFKVVRKQTECTDEAEQTESKGLYSVNQRQEDGWICWIFGAQPDMVLHEKQPNQFTTLLMRGAPTVIRSSVISSLA